MLSRLRRHRLDSAARCGWLMEPAILLPLVDSVTRRVMAGDGILTVHATWARSATLWKPPLRGGFQAGPARAQGEVEAGVIDRHFSRAGCPRRP
jgi:hypothetical protein